MTSFWLVAWSHLILTLVAVGLALFTALDTAWDYRLVRTLNVNGIYLAMTMGSFLRALATLGLTLLLAFGSLVRVIAGLRYPTISSAVISFAVILLLIALTSSDWVVRRRVMTEIQLQTLPPPETS